MQVPGYTIEIPEKSAACEQWKIYFEQLKKEVGKENARMLWLITWKENGSTSCTTSSGFNRWLKKNEIDVSNAMTRAIADVSQISGNILGMGKGIAKLLQIGIPITLGLLLIGLLFVLMKSARSADAADLVKLAPQAKALKLMS